jgi:hypothetical protein
MASFKKAEDEGDSAKLKLLSDLHDNWPADKDFWETAAIVDCLTDLDDSPFRVDVTPISGPMVYGLVLRFDLASFGFDPSKPGESIADTP